MKKSRRKRQSLVVQDGSISHTVSQMEAKKEAFLKAVVQAGSISLAAHAVGIDRRTHYYWKERDPEYFEKFKDATAEYREHLCENIETEIYRRGHDGVDKPVYQGGKRVGTVREYSDLLVIFRAKAEMPEKYRETPPPAVPPFSVVYRGRGAYNWA